MLRERFHRLNTLECITIERREGERIRLLVLGWATDGRTRFGDEEGELVLR